MKSLITFIVVVFLSFPAKADLTIGTLVAVCMEDVEVCGMYIEKVAGVLNRVERVCMPRDYKKSVMMFRRYLYEHRSMNAKQDAMQVSINFIEKFMLCK